MKEKFKKTTHDEQWMSDIKNNFLEIPIDQRGFRWIIETAQRIFFNDITLHLLLTPSYTTARTSRKIYMFTFDHQLEHTTSKLLYLILMQS